jgi:predicted nucleic acid-binding protein
MIVVSDTSALTALLQVGLEGILLELFQEVVIPEAVERELRRAHAVLPSFILTIPILNRELVNRLRRDLDEGEAEAIALILEKRGDLLLIDERKGRRVARREGVPVIGLLGVLLEAKRRGIIPSLRETIGGLQTTAGFRISDALRERLLSEAGEQ